jgi:uridine kinase
VSEPLAARIAAAIPADGAATRVVAIDGRAGSGKTTLAAELAALLGAPVVDLERLYPGWDGLAAGAQLLVERVLEPWAAGEVAAIPRWDWERDAWGEPWRMAPPPLAIVEGVGAGVRAAAPYTSLLVWLELDAATRRARANARDGDLFRPHWERWAAQEDALLAAERTPERAGVYASPS